MSEPLRNGEATFTGIVPLSAGQLVLEFEIPSLGLLQHSLLIRPGPPVELRLLSAPTETHVWRPMSGLVLELVDGSGNRVIQDDSTRATVQLIDGQGSLEGELSRTAIAGTLDFSDLRFQGRGPITLQFTTSSIPSLQYTSAPIYAHRREIVANAFDANAIGSLSNVIAPPQILDCNSALNHLSEFTTFLKSQLNQLPTGQRNIFLREMCQRDREIESHVADYLRTSSGDLAGVTDPEGHFIPYGVGLWWDHGVDKVRNETQTIFSALKEAEVEIDRVILTAEEAISNWALNPNESFWQAMQNDPRYRSPTHGLNGRSIYDLLSFHHIYPNVYDWLNQSYAGQYLEFNELMRKRTNDYYNRAVADVIRELYPEALVSKYYTYETSVIHGIPDQNGHPQHLASELFPGPAFGTAQAGSLHGCGGQVFSSTRGPGGINYPDTRFNRFRYYANFARSMRLSSDQPIAPWVNYASHPCGVYIGSYYQEMIFHALLAGAESFSYWNPQSHGATLAQAEQLNEVLTEFGEVVGVSAFLNEAFTSLAPWTSPYMETCATFDRGTFCRLTIDLSSGDTAEAHVLQTNPLIVSIGGQSFEFPNRTVVRMPSVSSDLGLWLKINP